MWNEIDREGSGSVRKQDVANARVAKLDSDIDILISDDIVYNSL